MINRVPLWLILLGLLFLVSAVAMLYFSLSGGRLHSFGG